MGFSRTIEKSFFPLVFQGFLPQGWVLVERRAAEGDICFEGKGSWMTSFIQGMSMSER